MKIIDIAICVDNFDPKGLGRIRCVRYATWVGQQEKALDYKSWSDDDLFTAIPFLPLNINFIPEKGQTVKIVNYNTDKETVNTEYISGPFSTMHDFNSQTHSAQVENTTYGIGAKHGEDVFDSTKESGYKNPKSEGAFAKTTDYGVYGKYGSDVIFTENGLQLRGGKLISKKAATTGQKITSVSQPIMTEKSSNLYLKKFSTKKEFLEEKNKEKTISVSDLKYIVEYSVEDFIKSSTQIKFYVYELMKPYGNLYRTDNPKLYESPFIDGYYKLINSDGTTTSPTFTLSSESIEETYSIIRDALKTLHQKNLKEFNPVLPDMDLHPFYFRPTLESKTRVITGYEENRKTIFNNVYINSKCGPQNGLVFSMTSVNPPEITVVKKEKTLKDYPISSEQTFAALKSDKIFFLSTDTNESNKTIDFSTFNKYELTQENYLVNIDPNTYSTVRGENLLELLKAMIDLINGHQHNLIGPLVKRDPNYTRLMKLYESLENDLLNKSIRIN